MNLKINCLFFIVILTRQATDVFTNELEEDEEEKEVVSEYQKFWTKSIFAYIQRFFSHTRFKNYPSPVIKNQPKNINCSNFVYKTEYNILETIVRELLNNMYVNNLVSVNSGGIACKKVESWIKNLVNISITHQCSNVHVSYKLLDVITVLCKQTNNQIEYAIDTFRDAMKPLETLVNECIVNIIYGDNNNAERKLKLISGDDKIRYIVEQIYTKCNDVDNFNKILNFFKTVENARKCYIAYKFLSEKLKNSTNVWDIYHLYDNSSRIINYITYSEIESNASNLHEELRYKLVKFVYQELWSSYLHETTQILLESNLLMTIHGNYKNIYYDGFKMFIKSVKNEQNNSIKLMEFIRRRHFYDEMILGLKAIEETLQLNDTEMLSLALHIKYLSIVLNKLGQEEKLVQLKEKLPISMKNILFAQNVSIKNVGHNEYILVDENLFNIHKPKNDTSRSVIVQSNNCSNLVWTITCANNPSCGDQFYIYNNQLSYDSLLSVYCNNITNECKIIVKTSDNITNYDLWKIVPFGNYCYIKNVGQNGYMYATGNDIFIDTPDRSYVTMKNYQWYIENCSLQNIKV